MSVGGLSGDGVHELADAGARTPRESRATAPRRREPPRRAARRARDRREPRTSASASASGSPGGTRDPGHGRPRRCPGCPRRGWRRRRGRGRTPRRRRGRDPPTARGARARVASSSARATSGVASDSVQRVCCGEVRNETLGHVAKRPATDEVERRIGDARSREPPRIGEHVDRLVALEHAHEERDRPLRERRGLALEEGLEVHERRELRGRLDTGLADETATCTRRSSARRRSGEARSGRARPRAARAPCGAASRRAVPAQRDRHGCPRRSRVGTRASLRPSTRSAASCAPWASTASGRKSRSSRATRNGSERVERRRRRAHAAGSVARAGSADRPRRARRPALASTRTSSSAERAANFCSSDGESGSE